MLCPTDGATLLISERQGIEIDYCPTCRGVWLDRGELDKIIERSMRLDQEEAAAPPAPAAAPPAPPPAPAAPPPAPPAAPYAQPGYAQPAYPPHQPYAQPQHGYGRAQHQPHRRKSKASWLGEIFDI